MIRLIVAVHPSTHNETLHTEWVVATSLAIQVLVVMLEEVAMLFEVTANSPHDGILELVVEISSALIRVM
jgi:hypothetical protein